MGITDQNYFYFNSPIVQAIMKKGECLFSSSTPDNMMQKWLNTLIKEEVHEEDRLLASQSEQFRKAFFYANNSRINAYKYQGNVLLSFTLGSCRLDILHLANEYKSSAITIPKGLSLSLGSDSRDNYAYHLHNMPYKDLPYKTDAGKGDMSIHDLAGLYYRHVAVQYMDFITKGIDGIRVNEISLSSIEYRMYNSVKGVAKMCYHLVKNHIKPLLLNNIEQPKQLSLFERLGLANSLNDKAKKFNDLFLLTIGEQKLMSADELLRQALTKPQLSMLAMHDIAKTEPFQAKMLHQEISLDKAAFRESVFYTIEKASNIIGYDYSNEPKTLIELYIKHDDIISSEPFDPYNNFFECKMFTKLHGQIIEPTDAHIQVAHLIQYNLKENMTKVMKEKIGGYLKL